MVGFDRLRGPDFDRAWYQSRWAEDVLRDAINRTGIYQAHLYGASTSREPAADLLGAQFKRPDLLIFDLRIVASLPADSSVLLASLPDLPEERVESIVRQAILAVEVESSLMRVLGTERTKPPSFTLKLEDKPRIQRWRDSYRDVELAMAQFFFDGGFGISWGELEHRSRRMSGRKDPKTGKRTLFVPIDVQGDTLGSWEEPPRTGTSTSFDRHGILRTRAWFDNGRFALQPRWASILLGN